MRLLHTATGRFHNVDDPRTVRYAILSHTWARENEPYYPEMSYQDICRIHDDQDAKNIPHSVSVIPQFPSEKIRRFCEIAAAHNYDYAWADTPCIDQASSSELSEAINSMYDWYRYAGVCYVFLHDVPSALTTAELEAPGSYFRNSRWHKRGWTLQELLAPSVVVFLSSEWRIIGTKHTLAHLVQAVTGIDSDVLTGQRTLEEFSVACRMSWASSRETKRDEDEAYSLMGIFGVNMPTTYGEGRYAFIRLQEEILKHITDQTIFAWGPALSNHNFSFHHLHQYRSNSDLLTKFQKETSSQDQFLLASSPRDFRYSSTLVSIPWDEFMRLLKAPLDHRPTYTMTSYGVRTRLPLLAVRAKDNHTNVPTCVALLACKDGEGNLMTLLLRSQPKRPEVDYFVGAVVGHLREIMGSIDNIEPFSMTPAFLQYYFRTASLSADDLKTCSLWFHSQEIYIPYRPSLASYSLQRDIPLHSHLRSAPSDSFDLRVSTWSQELLKMAGYCVTHYPGRNPSTIAVTNIADAETINIYVGRCDCSFGVHERFLNVDVCMNRPDRPVAIARPAPHLKNHDGHIQSWTFRNGAASKEFYLRSAADKRTSVRLSLTKAAETYHSYILGIEVWKTREEDVERERRRLKSLITGGVPQSSLDPRNRSRLSEGRKPEAPPLQRTRSSSEPPDSVSVEVIAPILDASQSNSAISSALPTPIYGLPGPPFLTPPVSRDSSWNVGPVRSPWGADLSDAESWPGLVYPPATDEQSRMDVDTPAMSPTDLQTRSAPVEPQEPAPPPKPSQSEFKKPAKKANTIDDLYAGLPHNRSIEPPPRETGRSATKRQSLPVIPLQLQPVTASGWAEHSIPFRGSPEPKEEGYHRSPARSQLQLPTDVQHGAADTATRKIMGKRRAEDTPASAVPSAARPTFASTSIPRQKPEELPSPKKPMEWPKGSLRKIIPARRSASGSSGTSSGTASTSSVPITPAQRMSVRQGVGSSVRHGGRRGGRQSGSGAPSGSRLAEEPDASGRPGKRRKL